MPHTVHLVGAGPGDPGLMTVKGLAALQRADVVIYDHLISPQLLDRCPPEALRLYAGKSRGRQHLSQARINRLLVRYARAGKRVVRLKGGDPMLFGRGGEEALALADARVPFEIVPGVTSALAVPAYAGIPVTHRALASSVLIVTGHEDPRKPDPSIRWDRVATAADTLVCLMGVGTLPSMVRQLLAGGRAASTPVAVVQWGTVRAQRTVTGSLRTIVSRCRSARIAAPAVVVVGEVVGLRKQIAWYESKPLFGKRIAVTRPSERGDGAAEQLEALGAEVVRLPAVAFAPVPANGLFSKALESFDRFDWVVFNSPEGIGWFRRLLAARRKDMRVLQGRHIAAIGPKTAASIEALGIHVDYVPSDYSQEGLLAGLAKRRVAGRGALILSARGSRDVLERGLKARGMRVLKVPIYQSVVPPSLRRQIARVIDEPVDFVTVTSASCVEHLHQAMAASRRGRAFASLPFASIGPVTSAAVRRLGGRVAVEARRSTMEDLVKAIASR